MDGERLAREELVRGLTFRLELSESHGDLLNELIYQELTRQEAQESSAS